MNVVASQPGRLGEQDLIDLPASDGVPQTVEAGAFEAGPTVAVIQKEDAVLLRLLLALAIGVELGKLVLDGLGLSLVGTGDPRIQGNPHGVPPSRKALRFVYKTR